MPITQNSSPDGSVKFYNETDPSGELSDIYATRKKIYIDFYHPASGRSVTFKAFITEWSDSFTSNWNPDSVYGRNDPITTFQGTERRISLGWAVPSHSVTEAFENVERIKELTKFLYPAYEIDSKLGKLSTDPDVKFGTLAKAPLVKIRFANMIMDSKAQSGGDSRAKEGGLVVAMSGLNINPNIDVGFWDSTASGIHGDGVLSNADREFQPNGEGIILAKIWNLSSELTVLHQHQLGWDSTTHEWLGPESFPYGLGTNESTTVSDAPQGLVEEPETDAMSDEQTAALVNAALLSATTGF